jgi:hypothetical protein
MEVSFRFTGWDGGCVVKMGSEEDVDLVGITVDRSLTLGCDAGTGFGLETVDLAEAMDGDE